jgi:ABC-type transport system involved in cytochrome bd biosynthesis fused ATPase/permease subunit
MRRLGSKRCATRLKVVKGELMNAIETNKLTRAFGSLVAVDDLTLAIPEGTVFGFLGPNGADKTTTVRLLSALIAPTRGSAAVAGHHLGEHNEAIRQAVGILTETPGLYNFSPRHFLKGNKTGKKSKKRGKAEKEGLLGEEGMNERRDRPSKQHTNKLEEDDLNEECPLPDVAKTSASIFHQFPRSSKQNAGMVCAGSHPSEKGGASTDC